MDRTLPPPSRAELTQALEQLLREELGTFPGGNPSIWVDVGDVPSTSSGLLCLIDFFENIRDYCPTANHGAVVNFDWVIKLVQRDRSPPGLTKLDRALNKLREEFPIHQERPAPPVDGVYPQITFFANFNRSACYR
jgi:hypothetical protein